jgi:hypothetical protein
MKTTLENPSGFDVLHVEGRYTWDEAAELPEHLQGTGGIHDLVLPDRLTLAALAALDGIKRVGWHWSASPFAGDSGLAWGVHFSNGGIDYYGGRNYSGHVCLVRASQCLAIGRAAQAEAMREAGIVAPAAQPAPPQAKVDQRAHEVALLQWTHWKQYAFELSERLRKYEPGVSHMVLNAAPFAESTNKAAHGITKGGAV